MREKYIDERFPTWKFCDDKSEILPHYIEAVVLIKSLCEELDKTEEGRNIIRNVYYGQSTTQ